MKKIILTTILLTSIPLLSGCSEPYCPYESNTERREKIFNECLEKVPDGPEQTHYNDWSEVVAQCGDEAYYISQERVCNNN
jgi:hypothetical protein